MVESSFTIETKCIVWHQIFERQTQRTVLQTLTLRLSCIFPTLRINTIICYHSSKHNLETSVILSLGKCARPHSFHSSPIARTFIRSFFYSIESFYIAWNCFWITAYKTSNNILQISCCEFEYFSINKRYTSRRRQRNERTKSQNERARI